MVQALAFAEIFLGLILADAGYKGVSISTVVKGEADKEVAPAPLGSGSTSSSGSTSAGGGEGAPGSKAAPNPFTTSPSPGHTLPTLAPGTGGPGAFNWPTGTVQKAREDLEKEPGGIFVPKTVAK
jgi:hypothetical protein